MQKYIFLLEYPKNYVILYLENMNKVYLSALFAIILLVGCSPKKDQPEATPWGTPVGEMAASTDSTASSGNGFSYDDIVANGEIIMLTVNGPATYYSYHNHGMGLQYLLCEKFAQKIGVSLRVEECKDTAEMVGKLEKGEGDVIAVPLSRKSTKGDLLFCGVTPDSTKTQWAVVGGNKSLADSLNAWFKPAMIAQVKQEEAFLLSTRSIKRHVYSPFLNRTKGVISKYDGYFQRYAGQARMDWRLMAAQCYQESCFDPNAKSWAGACGLMQIMPSTAAHLGLPLESIHQPEANIAAAARYMAELQGHFSDIGDPGQRILFALASYNGGFYHIRDAMALTRKYGGNPHNWGEVREYVLRLSNPAFYGDPVVKRGYMRGTETANYVDRIRARWEEYCGVASGGRTLSPNMGNGFHGAPMKATHKNKYKI